MKNRNTIGQILFWVAFFVGVCLYGLTAPDGMPWGGSTHAALSWIGAIPSLPQLTNATWGYFVRVFYNSAIMLACFSAAASAGLIAAMVNRYLGWRVGIAAAIFWIFSPAVWDRAILGARGAALSIVLVVAFWVFNWIVLKAIGRTGFASSTFFNENEDKKAETPVAARRAFINRIIASLVLCTSVLFALVSITRHDYMLGEAASVYAKDVLAEANGRIIVLNDVADDQMYWENAQLDAFHVCQLISSNYDDESRRRTVQFLKAEWATETNLIAAAQVSPITFAELAVKKHPSKFYTMNGQSTTLEGWRRRWDNMKRFRNSKDPFIPAAKAIFSYEGNVLASEMQDKGKVKEAWQLYQYIYEEIDNRNISTMVNMMGMISNGQKVPAMMKQRLEASIDSFFKANFPNGMDPQYVELFLRQFGPIWVDSAKLEKMRAELRKKMEAQSATKQKTVKRVKVTNGVTNIVEELYQPMEIPEWIKTLVEMNDEMLRAHDTHDITNAAHIARKILSNREWRTFVPANAIMGVAMAEEGDYVSAEVFFRTAVGSRKEPPAVLCNDFADTLMHLEKYDEAEKFLRLAIKDTAVSDWIPRYTLLQLLTRTERNPEERKQLTLTLKKQVPPEVFRKLMEDMLK